MKPLSGKATWYQLAALRHHQNHRIRYIKFQKRRHTALIYQTVYPPVDGCARTVPVMTGLGRHTGADSERGSDARPTHQRARDGLIFTGTRNTALNLAALAARPISVSRTALGQSKNSTCELACSLILSATRQLESRTALLRSGPLTALLPTWPVEYLSAWLASKPLVCIIAQGGKNA